MIIDPYVFKAVQAEAQRGGERDRLILEARRVRRAHREHAVRATPVRRVARLLLRRAPA